jgi:hypothetical protein
MTANDTFSRTLSTWLIEESEHRVPDHLAEVLVQTAATRQRPWWSSPERWLPMDTTLGLRAANPRPILVFVLLAVLLAAVGAIAFVASQPTMPFGLADNGRIYVASGTTLTSYAADGTDPVVVKDLPPSAEGLSFSPDGSLLAYFTSEPARLEVFDIDADTTSPIAIDGAVGVGGPISWSPDGSRFFLNIFDGTDEHIYMVTPEGGGTREVAAGLLPPGNELWPAGWSPTGDRIAVVAVNKPGAWGSIFVMRPDGTDLERLGASAVLPDSVSWSPDPRTARLLYTDGANPLDVRMLDVDTGIETSVGEGQWPVWSPDASRIALWNRGTQVLTTAAVLAGTPDPEYVFAQPSHTQPGLAPLPGRFEGCDNAEQLRGSDICQAVRWSPDGTTVYGPDINGGAVVYRAADGSGIVTTFQIDPAPDGRFDVAWRPMPR